MISPIRDVMLSFFKTTRNAAYDACSVQHITQKEHAMLRLQYGQMGLFYLGHTLSWLGKISCSSLIDTQARNT